MLLSRDRWIAFLEKAGFINLGCDHFNKMGAFLVEKGLHTNWVRTPISLDHIGGFEYVKRSELNDREGGFFGL